MFRSRTVSTGSSSTGEAAPPTRPSSRESASGEPAARAARSASAAGSCGAPAGAGGLGGGGRAGVADRVDREVDQREPAAEQRDQQTRRYEPPPAAQGEGLGVLRVEEHRSPGLRAHHAEADETQPG